jgi:hypothetical protein
VKWESMVQMGWCYKWQNEKKEIEGKEIEGREIN